MKKLIALIAVATILVSCNSNRGWTASDRKKVISSCIDEAKGTELESRAESYCTCMQPILEAKYPTVAEANKVKVEDITGDPQMKKEALKCLGMDDKTNNGDNTNTNNNGDNVGTGWTADQRDTYTRVCADEAVKVGNTQEKANTYCACMVAKLEAKMSYEKANLITTAELGTDEWKAAIAECQGN